jgi:hypothetical protein
VWEGKKEAGMIQAWVGEEAYDKEENTFSLQCRSTYDQNLFSAVQSNRPGKVDTHQTLPIGPKAST